MEKFAIAMHLPEDKRPGFYGQIVKGIAAKATLFDRDKDLLIADSGEDRELLVELLDKLHVAFDRIDLLLLPENAWTSAILGDYGVETRAGNRYVQTSLTALFTFADGQPDEAEPEAALLQLQELLIGRFASDGADWYVIDREQQELAERIASSYRCLLAFR